MEEKYKQDAEDLHRELMNKSKDKDPLIKIVTKRTLKERLKIRELYISTFGIDLMEDLKKLDGDLEKAFKALFTDLAEYDADCIFEAIDGAGTDEDALIEILGSRPCWHIKKIKEIYLSKRKVDIEKDIKGDTSSHFLHLLIALTACGRKTNQNPDVNECENIAKELFEKEGKKDEKSEALIKYFSTCSPHELLQIARSYHKLTNNLLTKALIGKEDEDKLLLHTILYSNISPSEYFASRIHYAIEKGKEKILNRVVIGRSDIDIPIIKQYYKQLYNKEIVEDVKEKFKGDYEKLIEAILTR